MYNNLKARGDKALKSICEEDAGERGHLLLNERFVGGMEVWRLPGFSYMGYGP